MIQAATQTNYTGFTPFAGMATVKTKKRAMWVNKRHFLQIAKISAERFDRNKSKYKNVAGKWECRNEDDGIYIDVASIPNRTDYVTADDDVLRLLVASLKADEQKAASCLDIEKYNRVLCNMSLAMNTHPQYFNLIRDAHPGMKTERVTEAARRHSLFVWIKANYTAADRKVIYEAYRKLMPGHFKGETSINAFDAYLKNFAAREDDSKAVDRRSVTKRQPNRSAKQMALLLALYTKSAMVTAADAFRKVVPAAVGWNEKPMSHSTVKNVFREFEKNKELYTAKYGATMGAKKDHYASMLPAKNANSQWQMDGKRGAFFVRTEDGSAERYTLFLVLDNHSRKFIGYSIGRSENTELIFEGLENAVGNTGYLPYEMIFDQHSATRTKHAALFVSEYEKMGGTFTATTNPQAKSYVERYNSHLDAIFKDYPGYLGQGMTAKNKNARPSQEELAEINRPKNYLAPDEFKAMVIHTIAEYNNTPLPALNGKTPNQAYEQSEVLHAFAISETERVRLFKPANLHTVSRGEIVVIVGGKKHRYQLSAALTKVCDGRQVEVRYEDLKEGIYLFEPGTEAYIGEVKPKYMIHGAKADQTEEDRRHLNMLKGRKTGTKVQARKKVKEISEQTLVNNPELVDAINHMVAGKDIIQQMQQSADLRRSMKVEGVDADKIPLRKQTPALVVPASIGRKQKESPFSSTSPNVMKLLSADDILNMTE